MNLGLAVRGDRRSARARRSRCCGWRASPSAIRRGCPAARRSSSAIASLLAMRPRHVILDEPTAQLDPAGTRLVGEALRAARRARHVAADRRAQDGPARRPLLAESSSIDGGADRHSTARRRGPRRPAPRRARRRATRHGSALRARSRRPGGDPTACLDGGDRMIEVEGLVHVYPAGRARSTACR